MNITLRQPLGFTHIGKKENQEDSVYPPFEDVSEKQKCFVLCDGVGGMDCGEVASRTVCDVVGKQLDYLIGAKNSVEKQDIEFALSMAYDALDSKAEGSASEGMQKMATTFTCVCFHSGGVSVAHIGDSRIYHIRPKQGILYQSEDHSLVNALLSAGELTPEEAVSFNRKNVITRAVSPRPNQRYSADIFQFADVRSGDYFFMCCDGVLEQLTNDRLVEILSLPIGDKDKLKLIEAECLDKTRDNFTAYLIPVDRVEGDTVSSDLSDIVCDEVCVQGVETVCKKVFSEKLLPMKKHIITVFVSLLVISLGFGGYKYYLAKKEKKVSAENVDTPQLDNSSSESTTKSTAVQPEQIADSMNSITLEGMKLQDSSSETKEDEGVANNDSIAGSTETEDVATKKDTTIKDSLQKK